MNRLNDNEERDAQRIACGHLVRGCEGAISELEAAPGETDEGSRTRERAQEIVGQVLLSWRQAMSVETPSRETLSNEANLEDWTSDELFAEALSREAGDAPALRVMQGRTLEAQLTAHDRGS